MAKKKTKLSIKESRVLKNPRFTTCFYKDVRFCGARAQSSRKTALSKYTIKSEIPSLAHSTPHNSNRNGSSTASYTSSGGNYALLSLKSPQFNN